MKKFSLHNIMKSAWRFFRKGVSSFAVALRMAWSNAKRQNAAKVSAQVTEETHTWYGWKNRGYEVRHDSKAAAVIGGKQIVKIPKTRNSYRLVPIPRSITEQLQQLKLEQTRYRLKVGAYWQGENWIFTQENGKMMNYSTPYSALQDILNHYNADKSKGNKLPMIPFHGLQHTKATLQIAAGCARYRLS